MPLPSQQQCAEEKTKSNAADYQAQSPRREVDGERKSDHGDVCKAVLKKRAASTKRGEKWTSSSSLDAIMQTPVFLPILVQMSYSQRGKRGSSPGNTLL